MVLTMDRLATIAHEITHCRACVLCEAATNPVPGEGPANARVMLIGEAPGEQEDRLGRPFVGRSGKLLDTLLELAGLAREQVFIANVVKHRPPANRDPLPAEIAACRHFLVRQIALIQPAVIVTLGRHAAGRWLPGIKITQAHGVVHHVGQRVVIPMLHPATALYQPSNLPLLQADFRHLGHVLTELTG